MSKMQRVFRLVLTIASLLGLSASLAFAGAMPAAAASSAKLVRQIRIDLFF